MLQKNWMMCTKSSPRVIKTTRLRFDELESWVASTDIKVVLGQS